MAAPGVEERAAFADAMAFFGALIGAGIGLALLLGSRDSGMAFHGLLFMLAGLFAAVFILQRSFDDNEPREASNDYMDGPIRVATIAAVIWGIAGFIVGDVIAWQLAFPKLNFDLPWTSFGRLRPLHTSAVIFAFGGNVLLATSFYVVQRRAAGRPNKASLSCCERSNEATNRLWQPESAEAPSFPEADRLVERESLVHVLS